MNCTELESKVKEISKKYGIKEFLNKIEEKKENINLSIAFLGEFSSGKSTLVNALIEKKILPTMDEPTTASIVEVYGGTSFKAFVDYQNFEKLEEISISDLSQYVINPNEEINKVVLEVPESGVLKKGFRFVDTPGIQSLNEVHDDITFGYLPKVDAAVLVLDVNYGGATESLINFLKNKILDEDIKKLVFVLNKIDTIKEADVEKAVENLKNQLKGIIDNPIIVPVSAKLALERKENSNIKVLKNVIIKTILSNKTKLAEERYCKELKKKSQDLVEHLEELEKSIDLSTNEIDTNINQIEIDIKRLQSLENKIKKEVQRFEEDLFNSIDFIINDKAEMILQYSLDRNNEELERHTKEMADYIKDKVELGLTRLNKKLNQDISTLNLSTNLQSNIIYEVENSIAPIRSLTEGFSMVVSGIIIAYLSPFMAGAAAGEVTAGTIATGALQVFTKQGAKKAVVSEAKKAIASFIKDLNVPEKLLKFGAKKIAKNKVKEELKNNLKLTIGRITEKIEIEIEGFIEDEILPNLEEKKELLNKLLDEKQQKILNTIEKKKNVRNDINLLKQFFSLNKGIL